MGGGPRFRDYIANVCRIVANQQKQTCIAVILIKLLDWQGYN